VKDILKLVIASFIFLTCGLLLFVHEFHAGVLSQQGLRSAVIFVALVNVLGIVIGILWLGKRDRQH